MAENLLQVSRRGALSLMMGGVALPMASGWTAALAAPLMHDDGLSRATPESQHGWVERSDTHQLRSEGDGFRGGLSSSYGLAAIRPSLV